MPSRSVVPNKEWRWDSKHEDFGPRTTRIKARGPTHYQRLLPLHVPDGFAFQQFTDGILPKIMMHLNVIHGKYFKILVPRAWFGLAPYIRHTGMVATADEMYSGCTAPPIHPLWLWSWPARQNQELSRSEASTRNRVPRSIGWVRLERAYPQLYRCTVFFSPCGCREPRRRLSQFDILPDWHGCDWSHAMRQLWRAEPQTWWYDVLCICVYASLLG